MFPQLAPIVAEQQTYLQMNSRLYVTLALYVYLTWISREWTFSTTYNNPTATARKTTDIVLASSNLHYNQMFPLVSNAYVDQYVQIRIQSSHVAVILNLIEATPFKLVLNIHFKVNILYRPSTTTFPPSYFGWLYCVGINKGK